MSSLHCTSQQYTTHTHTHYTPRTPHTTGTHMPFCELLQRSTMQHNTCNPTFTCATRHHTSHYISSLLITLHNNTEKTTEYSWELCITQHCSTLHSTTLHLPDGITLHFATLHNTTPHYTITYVTLYTLKYTTPLCSTLPHSTTSYHHDHPPTRYTTVC